MGEKKHQQSHPKTTSSESVEGFSESSLPDILGPQILDANSSFSTRSTTLREAIVAISIVEISLREGLVSARAFEKKKRAHGSKALT